MSALSAAAFLVMVLGLVLQYWLHRLLSSSPVVIAVQVAAVLTMVWARVTFGRRSFHATAGPTEGGLVTTGPYRFVRHPIYASVCWFSAAGAAAFHDLPALLCVTLVVLGALTRMGLEERLLAARYPEYRAYAARTARMIPGVF
ncbi:MAG: isoprenylcysteine carboxylmethyltransferase family protein [Vicinamibacterales bacterium]